MKAFAMSIFKKKVNATDTKETLTVRLEESKKEAAFRLSLAKVKLAKLIADKEKASSDFKSSYNSLIKAQEYICKELQVLSA